MSKKDEEDVRDVEVTVVDMLSPKNSEYLDIIEEVSKIVCKYSEFVDIHDFYESISIILFDEESDTDEVIRMWGEAVNLSLDPPSKRKFKASSISNDNKGSIYISIPFIFDELPPKTEVNDYLEYILHHEFCHLKLHQGKIIKCSQSLMALLKMYEKIPTRKVFGKSLVDSLRQNNEHYFVNKNVIERYPILFLKQRNAEKERMTWKMEYYPRMTHKFGLDMSISEALCETIKLVRKILELETIDEETDELMTFFTGLYDMFISLISKSVSPPDITNIFTADIFSDRHQYSQKIYEIWDTIQLADPLRVPMIVGEGNCGICRKKTRSHSLDYGGSVCHSCWTTFFK